jgi:Mn2+/Fe2+ NRAMP family transporter
MTNRAIAIPANEAAVQPMPVRGTIVRSKWAARLLTFLAVFGPGLIVMVADNDAGAVSTYSQAGAQYGLSLMWLVMLLLPVTYFVQEMVVRLGIATGKGHAAMIYQRFGKWWGLFSLVDLEAVNFLTLVTEFACIDLALTKLGVDPRIGLPLVAVGLVIITATSSYRRWERMVVFLCLLDLSWFVIAWKLQPGGGQVVRSMLVPGIPSGGLTADLIFLVIAIVGTTIAPWQLFFQQSCIADKRLRFADIPWARLDTFVGACVTISVAACMMIAGNASRVHGFHFTDPAEMAVNLGSIAGPWLKNAILLMMINAAVLGTSAISLSSAWAYGEVKGWPHSLQLSFRKAKGFYGVYLACVVLAAGLVLIPGAPLQLIILGVQVLAGVMLPSAIIFLQLLLNDRDLLGEYANKPWNNVVNWTIIAVLFGLSLILAAQVTAPALFPASGGPN